MNIYRRRDRGPFNQTPNLELLLSTCKAGTIYSDPPWALRRDEWGLLAEPRLCRPRCPPRFLNLASLTREEKSALDVDT